MGNLLRSNGQPVKELDVSWLPGSPPPRPSQSRVGASIKPRLQLEDGSHNINLSVVLDARAFEPLETVVGNGHVGRSQARLSSDIPTAPTPIFDQARRADT